MPTIVNTYTNPDVSIGKSLEDLGNSIWGPQAAASEYAKQKARGANRNNSAHEALVAAARAHGGTLDFNDPNVGANVIGLDNPRETMQGVLGVAANRYGAAAPQTDAAARGAGEAYGSTAMGVREGYANQRTIAQMQADRAAAAERYKADNTPQNVIVDGQPQIVSRSAAIGGHMTPVLGDSEATGALKMTGFPSGYKNYNDEQKKAAGAFVPPDHVFNYVAPGVDGQPITGRTIDGQTDLTTGKPIDRRAQIVAASNPGGTNTFSGTFGPNSKEMETARGSYQSAKDLGDLADFGLAMAQKNPLIVGAPGNIREVAQNVGSVAQNIAGALGHGQDYASSLANIRAQLDHQTGGRGAQLVPELYDNKIDLLRQIHGMLVYKYAEGVFGQSGRDLSDRDVHQARVAVGDPTAWLQGPEAFQNAMKTVSSVARQKQAQAEHYLKNGTIVGAPSIISPDMRQRAGIDETPAAAAPAPPAPQPDQNVPTATGPNGQKLYLRNGQWSTQ